MRERETAEPLRALVVRSDRFGELVLTLPAAYAMANEGYEVDLMVAPYLMDLCRLLPWVNEVLADPRRDPRGTWIPASQLAAALKPRNYRVALAANPMKSVHLGLWLSRIPHRIGYRRKWPWLLSESEPLSNNDGHEHEVPYNFRLAERAGVSKHAKIEWGWRIPESLTESIRQRLYATGKFDAWSNQKPVLIHPWTSNPTKQWPLDRYAAILKLLGQEEGVVPIIIGGPEEKALAQEWCRHLNGVINWTGELTLTELAALFALKPVLLSNDSGPVHLAASMGSPVVAIFGTRVPGCGPRRWGPWGTHHQVLHQPSMKAVSIETVWRAYQRLSPAWIRNASL